jgi:uncharacterized protein
MKQNYAKPTQQEGKGCFLWEVKGGNAKMYLTGTIHIVPESFFPLKQVLLDRFDECSNLVLEVILDDRKYNGIEITGDILNNKSCTYEDGDSLYNHFPKDKIIALRNYMVKNKLCPPELSKKFYKLRPEVVNYILRNGLYKKAGINMKHLGIDFYFLKRAKEMGKNLMELETKEQQEEILAKALGKLPEKKPENEELPVINNGLIDRFLKLKVWPWFFGNYVERCSSVYGNESKISKQREKLLSIGSPLIGKRDEEMIKKLLGLLKNRDSYFVAVGAAHLIGKDSIIEKLKNQGYEVIRTC